MPPSAARARYESLVNADDPAKAIRDMINSTPPTFEDDFFDCKIEPFDADVNKRKAALQKTWSEVLTAFANSGGGVLVWGLDARSNPTTKIDAVIGERLVGNLALLENDLRRLQPEQTDPPLGGVEFTQVPVEGGPGGFLVCFIPEGLHKPYQQLRGERQYWYRAGDTSRVMQRHMLQAMFYPRTTPGFRCEVEMTWHPVDPPGHSLRRHLAEVKFVLRLRNTGTASAKDTTVCITHFYPGGHQKAQLLLSPGWQSANQYFERRTAIHPSTPAIGVVSYIWEHATGGPDGIPFLQDTPHLLFAVYAENAAPHYFIAKPTKKDLFEFEQRKDAVFEPRQVESLADDQGGPDTTSNSSV